MAAKGIRFPRRWYGGMISANLEVIWVMSAYDYLILATVGYCYSIRSERRLCQEVRMNLAYRWFCGLGLEDTVPHHSTFSVNRLGRFRDSDILRKVFEDVVCGCMAAGLVGGEGFAVDASVIEANASRFQRVKGSEVDWTDEQRSSRPVRESLVALESDNPPINPKQKPKAMSPSDPCAAWTARGRYEVMFGYSLNYLIDMEHAVIVDVEATPTRISMEVDATEAMIQRTQERLALKPKRIAGDVAYGTGEMLGWLVEHDITPHIPVWDQSEVAAVGKFARADFAYDRDRNLYICPGGRELKRPAQFMTAPRSSISLSGATAPAARSSPNAPLVGNAGSRVTSIRRPVTIPNH